MVVRMENFTEKIDKELRESTAYSNRFFDNCHNLSREVRLDDVADMAVNWYLVTKHFGLSAPVYTGVLARELRNSNGEKSKLLQHLLVESAMISGDDLGLGHEELYDEHGGGEIPHNERIHYKLWGDMTSKILRTSMIQRLNSISLDGLTIEGAQLQGLVKPETVDLVRRFENEFMSVEGGASVYQTVESAAYNIVDAYSELMKKLQNGGGIVFDDRDLVYIEIHKPLEKEHDVQSTSIIDLVDQYFDGRYELVIKTKVRENNRLFGNFWEAMNKIVFGE
jgi:hypothetical protein